MELQPVKLNRRAAVTALTKIKPCRKSVLALRFLEISQYCLRMNARNQVAHRTPDCHLARFPIGGVPGEAKLVAAPDGSSTCPATADLAAYLDKVMQMHYLVAGSKDPHSFRRQP